MRISSLWADLDPKTGRPILKPGLRRSITPDLKEKVRDYLTSGTLVMRAPGRRQDYLDSGRVRRVPIAFYTDGDWIWSAEDSYYLTKHDVVPDPEFVAHMSEHDFAPKTPDARAIREATELLSK